MENQIFETLCMLDEDKITLDETRKGKHLGWEYLQHEIRKFTMNFSQKLVKEENKNLRKT